MIEDLDNQAATLRKMARKAAQGEPPPARQPSTPEQLARRKVPHTIAITSGKGGVGKTLVTVNLAIHFAQQGLRVLLIDADLGLANIDVVLGLTPRFTIQDVLDGDMSLDQVAIEGPFGIKILPAASGVAELSTMSEEQRLTLMDQLDNWNTDFDVVLVDTGAGISSNVRYFVLAVEHILVVATPDPASITDAYALMKVMFLNHRIDHFDLLINQAKSQKEALDVFRTVQRVVDRFLNIGLNFAGYIPHDGQLSQAVRRQKAVSELFPDSPASHAFGTLSDNIIRLWAEGERDKGRMTFFGRRGFG